MAQPVWVLSVDLQTKTATFQTGMADAAKSARGAFTDIKSGSGEMAGAVGGNMMEARHGVMLLGEEFGIHLPRALTSFIASIGPVGAAMEAAFPFLAIAVGATLLIEHLVKMHEAGEKLTQDQMRFGTAAQNAFNSLQEKLLQAEIRSDELRNDHLGALRKQLELIDKQSMADLMGQFDKLAKESDTVFNDLKKSWYQFGSGSAGAVESIKTFKSAYDDLLSKGDEKGASKLLADKVAREERILELKRQAAQASAHDNGATNRSSDDSAKFLSARNALQAVGAKWDDDAIKSQQEIVHLLREQVRAEGEIAETKNKLGGNAKQTEGNDASAKAAEAARQSAEHTQKMGEMALAAEREQTHASLSLRQASIAEKLAADIALADKEYAIQQTGNQQLIGALDKAGKDYNNQLKALHEKAEEETLQHTNAVAALTSKAKLEQSRKDITDLEQGEREKIDATMQGSAARLAVLDAAIKEEQSRQLQDTNFYRELLTQRTQTARQAAEEDAKLQAEAGKEAADNTEKMGQLALAAQKEHMALVDSARRATAQQRVAEEIDLANKEYALKLTALGQQAAALDKGAKEYQNKLKEIQDKQKQHVQQHENEITAIKDKAEMERNQRILTAEQRFNDEVSRGLTNVLMRHQSFASMMNSLGAQVAAGMMENAIKSVLADDYTKEHDAAKAARKAYNAGMELPFPANIIAGPVLGAAAFAAVMAFEGGTDRVPGIGRGDVVPAMLTPGEGVVPGGVMDGLRRMASSGSMGGGSHYHVTAHYAPQVNAIDATGVDKMLTKHADQFQRHFESTLRRMNH